MWPYIIGGGIVFVGIVIGEGFGKYSIGDKVFDIFRSAEAKVKAAEAYAARAAGRVEAAKKALSGK